LSKLYKLFILPVSLGDEGLGSSSHPSNKGFLISPPSLFEFHFTFQKEITKTYKKSFDFDIKITKTNLKN
jgi:hypothetical protein